VGDDALVVPVGVAAASGFVPAAQPARAASSTTPTASRTGLTTAPRLFTI